MPAESTPLSFPAFITKPSPGLFPEWSQATLPPSSTTGTTAPSKALGAPVTIWISLPSSSICTWQITSLSASGCLSILLILPTTILSRFLSKYWALSALVPLRVIASIYSAGVQSSPGTISFIHDKDVFMLFSYSSPDLTLIQICFIL